MAAPTSNGDCLSLHRNPLPVPCLATDIHLVLQFPPFRVLTGTERNSEQGPAPPQVGRQIQNEAAPVTDGPKMIRDFGFVMTLLGSGGCLRCPATPDPRDHLSHPVDAGYVPDPTTASPR
jgi:hypothetical protein